MARDGVPSLLPRADKVAAADLPSSRHGRPGKDPRISTGTPPHRTPWARGPPWCSTATAPWAPPSISTNPPGSCGRVSNRDGRSRLPLQGGPHGRIPRPRRKHRHDRLPRMHSRRQKFFPGPPAPSLTLPNSPITSPTSPLLLSSSPGHGPHPPSLSHSLRSRRLAFAEVSFPGNDTPLVPGERSSSRPMGLKSG